VQQEGEVGEEGSGARARGAGCRAQSADSPVSCKCTQNRCPTGSRAATPRSIESRGRVHKCHVRDARVRKDNFCRGLSRFLRARSDRMMRDRSHIDEKPRFLLYSKEIDR